MDSISAVARPDKVKRAISQRERALKSPQILLIKINFLWATKLERFIAVQLVWVRLRGSESRAPELGDFFQKRITY